MVSISYVFLHTYITEVNFFRVNLTSRFPPRPINLRGETYLYQYALNIYTARNPIPTKKFKCPFLQKGSIY